MPSAEVTCLHFHGTEIAKPIPNQQVYRGTVFDAVDRAVDFVMGTLTRAVVPSPTSVASTVSYEVPYAVIREAVVNAVAHRNYASKSGVQVMVFADRIEVWNPGGLPEDLTADQLRIPHPSVPRNRLLCEPLFLAHYIERAGSGTLDMIRLCAEAGLPPPEFRPVGERFTVIIWRSWLTEDAMRQMGLNDRQRAAIAFLRRSGRISNSEYQEVAGVPRKTALRDLGELVEKGLLILMGEKRGSHYVLAAKK
jgi:predicted HTH transcriptional regulator